MLLRRLSAARVARVDVDLWLFDLLLADCLADRRVLGDGLGGQPDALDRDGLLGHYGPLRPQGNLVLFLADRLAGQRGVAVSVGNRLTLHADFFVANRNGGRNVLGNDVLAQPRTSPLRSLRADPQLLLRAGHRAVGDRTGGVPARSSGGAFGQLAAVGVRCPPGCVAGAEVLGIVPVEGFLLAGVDLPVVVDARGVLDKVLGDSQRDLVTVEPGSGDRREALSGAEHAGGDGNPQRQAGPLIEIDLADLAHLAAFTVDRGTADELLNVLRGGHRISSPSANGRWAGDCPGAFTRRASSEARRAPDGPWLFPHALRGGVGRRAASGLH